MGDLSYHVRGSYFESCNCEAICPCRKVGNVLGGRSTYGECYGVLSWAIGSGIIDGIEVGGLSVALVYRYDDDEPGSPWSLVLHVDKDADPKQTAALKWLFLDGLHQLPWIRKARHLIGVRESAIEIAGTSVRVGKRVEARASRRFETDLPVACGVPGYDRAGYEMVADELRVDEEPFEWELRGNCAYASDFDYRST
ncbi:MAG: DUF1326 domain-containing protein [Actinobacteria bacterium]|nr:MAG: DUF1326 domain-containing protein [Actinomycetota bacterium]